MQSARGEQQLNASAGSWRGEKQPGLLRFVFVLCFHPRQLHNPERLIKEPSLLMVSAGILEAAGRRGEGATGLLSARSSSNEVFGAIPFSISPGLKAAQGAGCCLLGVAGSELFAVLCLAGVALTPPQPLEC